jgi:hypothetical protein
MRDDRLTADLNQGLGQLLRVLPQARASAAAEDRDGRKLD